MGGMGGPGRGRGGEIPDEPYSEVDWEKSKIKGKMGRGRTVGQMFVKGAQMRGDATEEYIEVLGEARQEAADALSKERIPRGCRDYVREYFNELDPESK